MTRSQIPHVVRPKDFRGASGAVTSEDPQLRLMLTSHVHCRQPMQLVTGDPSSAEDRTDAGRLTFRCVCGFSFDQRQG